MTSIMTESFFNQIKTEGNLRFGSNIKKMFNPIIEKEIHELFKTRMILHNLSLEETKTDILYPSKEKPDGFENVAGDDFIYANFNSASFVVIDNYKPDELPVETIPFEDSNGSKILNCVYYGNHVIFFEPDTKNNSFYIEFNEKYKLIDFKIDKNYFLHIIFAYNDEIFLSCTHIGLAFCNLNKSTDIHFDKLLYKIKLDSECKILSFSKNFDKVFVLNSANEIVQISLEKKYCFFSDGKYYSTHKTEGDNVQVEHLYFYEVLNMFGLNSFLKDGRKLDSSYSQKIKEIFKNSFSNTSNGKINYFNFFENKKDYHVNFSDRDITVSGNFIYNYESGEYKIIVDCFSYDNQLSNNQVSFTLIKDGVVVKTLDTFTTDGYAYFCNLSFFFKKMESNKFKKEIIVSANDSYPIYEKEVLLKDKEFSSETNNVVKHTMLNGEMIENPFLIKAFFDSKDFVFKNVFDYKNKCWVFLSSEKKLTNIGESFDVSNLKSYIVFGNHIEKNGKVYSRGKKTKVIFSTIDEIRFPIVDQYGNPSELWKNNQGKTLEVSIKENGVFTKLNNGFKEVEHELLGFENAIFDKTYPGFKMFLPEIKELSKPRQFEYKEVQVFDSQKNEVAIPYGKNTLVTDKFFNKPLFFKFSVDTLDDFVIETEDGEKITEYLTEYDGESFVVYYDRNPNKDYLYSNASEKNVYINKIPAHKNKEEKFYIENGLYNFESEKYIDYFSVVVEKDVDIFFYERDTVTAFSLEKGDSNVKIELKKNITHIKVVGSDKLLFTKTEYKNSIFGNTLVFNKRHKDDTVYVSEIIDVKIDGERPLGSNIGKNITYGPLEYQFPVVSNLESFSIFGSVKASIYDTFDEFFFENFKKPDEFYIINNHNTTASVKTKISDITF